MEITDLKGQMEVMKYLVDADDAAVQKKMSEMKLELADKVENLESLEDLNSLLIIKERQSNDEVEDARKVVIQVFLMTLI